MSIAEQITDEARKKKGDLRHLNNKQNKIIRKSKAEKAFEQLRKNNV
jgi:hypothetical protein